MSAVLYIVALFIIWFFASTCFLLFRKGNSDNRDRWYDLLLLAPIMYTLSAIGFIQEVRTLMAKK